MKERIARSPDAFDNRLCIWLIAFNQFLQVFGAGKIFITMSFSELTCDHKSHFLRIQFVDGSHRCVGHNKTRRKDGFSMNASYNSLCTRSCALEDNLSTQVQFPGLCGRVAEIESLWWNATDF